MAERRAGVFGSIAGQWWNGRVVMAESGCVAKMVAR
jgi:hypothetical protein